MYSSYSSFFLIFTTLLPVLYHSYAKDKLFYQEWFSYFSPYYVMERVRNGRAKIGAGSEIRFGTGRPKIVAGLKGSATVGGQMVMGLVRLYGSPTVVVWSKKIHDCRAKTARGAGEAFPVSC
jgi:hypothetical protein